MRGGDQQDVGAVDGERATADRTGDDARQIEHANARERSVAGRQWLRRRRADFLDGEQRQAGEGARLAVRVPFGERSARRDREAGLGRSLLQGFGAPALQRFLYGGAVVVAAEQLEQSVAVVG